MLNWVNRFNIFCLLDNHRYAPGKASFECLLAAGCTRKIAVPAGEAYTQLKGFYREDEWLFGHLGYDLKNETEDLASRHPDGIGFEDLCFFVPEIVLQLNDEEIAIWYDGDARTIISVIEEQAVIINADVLAPIAIKERMKREEYLQLVETLRAHIRRGDCYEINFCQEFFGESVTMDPARMYLQLTGISPNPFSALYKWEGNYCICASPERYLKKVGRKVFSQPIKGTSRRNVENAAMDELQKKGLLSDPKERSENVMVVDLVRNDLSKVCREGTVKVDELFGIYSFPQVHQMISTISGELRDDIHFTDIFKATFPMGSMTGVPKKKVMELIEKYERTRRGLFSGAIGYIDPRGDMDFNVVIRSVFYNSISGYLSFQVGGAITFNSDPGKEYEECMLKAEAIRKALENKVPA